MGIELTRTFLNSCLKAKADKLYTDPMTGMLVRVHPLKNQDRATVTFNLRVRSKGRDIRERIGEWPGTSLANARKEYYRIKDCIDRGKPWKEEAPHEENVMTVEEGWTLWRKKKDLEVGEKAQLKASSIYRNHISKIAAEDVKTVNPRMVMEKVINPMLDRKLFSSAQLAAATLKTLFSYLSFLGYVEKNNLEHIMEVLPKHKVTHFKTFSDEDLEAQLKNLFKAFQTESNEIKNLLLMQFFTLLRNSELRTLRWEQVSADCDYITVQTKCHPDFKVPLCTQAQAIVKENKRCRLQWQRYVLCNKQGNAFCDMALNRAFERKGIKLSVHGIRSIGRQWMQVAPGIKETVAELCLAHVVGNQTMQAYNRGTYFEARKEAMQMWGDFIESVIKSISFKIQ